MNVFKVRYAEFVGKFRRRDNFVSGLQEECSFPEIA